MEGSICLVVPKRAKSWPLQGFCMSHCHRLPPCPCSRSSASLPFRPAPPRPPATFYRHVLPHSHAQQPRAPHLALLLPHDVFVLILPVGIFQLLVPPGISCCLGLSPPCPGCCRLGVLALELLGHPSAGCGRRMGTNEWETPTPRTPRLTTGHPGPPWGLNGLVGKTRTQP